VLVVRRGELAENREKVRQHGLNFPVVLQKKWEISKLYAVFDTPAAYLIDGEGIIAADVATGAPSILDLFDRDGRDDSPAPPGAANGKDAGVPAAARSGDTPGRGNSGGEKVRSRTGSPGRRAGRGDEPTS
jgi:hypothetical protein